MADVYLGIQKNLKRKVAIKVLMPALLRDKTFALRFLREAQTAAQLHHPNIITIHDVGKEGACYYIIMEYLEEGLAGRLKQKGKFGLSEALIIIKEIAGALGYASSKGIIHRDIKPENIMFHSDGTPVLLDFGISRMVDSNTQLTETGMSIGTPNYMSPEQCKGEKADTRSDIYSLGVLLYELITGQIPFNAENAIGVILKHIQKPIPRLKGELSVCQPIINRMMAKNREERIQNGQEVIKSIDSLIGHLASSEIEISDNIKKIIKGYEEKTEVNTNPLIAGIKPKSTLFRRNRIFVGVLTVMLFGSIIYFLIQKFSVGMPGDDVPSGKNIHKISVLNAKEKHDSVELQKKDSGDKKNVDQSRKKKSEIKKAKTFEKKSEINNKVKRKKPESTDQKKQNRTVKKNKVKPLDFADLPTEIQIEHLQKTRIIRIENLQENIKVKGQMSLVLTVNKRGFIIVQDFTDKFLTIIPDEKRDVVKKIILAGIRKISFLPAKDKSGSFVQVENWILKFSVATLQNKIILMRNE